MISEQEIYYYIKTEFQSVESFKFNLFQEQAEDEFRELLGIKNKSKIKPKLINGRKIPTKKLPPWKNFPSIPKKFTPSAKKLCRNN